MKLVIIFGPHAVGKMTVGQALARQTGLKVFHNHMTIDPLMALFNHAPAERSRLTNLFREEIFQAFAKTDAEGMIFTYMWGLDLPQDWAYIEHVEEIFRAQGAEVYYVELEADFDLRIERNKKRKTALPTSPLSATLQPPRQSSAKLKASTVSTPIREIQKEHYLRINNSALSPEEAAGRIKAAFAL